MIEIQGKHNSARFYIDDVEEECISQTYKMINHPAFSDTPIRIMPDCHAGKGSVVGFTMLLNKYVVPNVVGVDIGCGVLSLNLGTEDIDYQQLDDFIRSNIPSGTKARAEAVESSLTDLKAIREVSDRTGQNFEYVHRSLGTLGSGNHFIEIDEDPIGRKWLTVHTGSRNFGLKVCEYHQKIAKAKMKELSAGDLYKDLEYLEIDKEGEQYYLDMKIAQQFAWANRWHIIETINEYLNRPVFEYIESVHNYITSETHDGKIVHVLRKGAVSAMSDERLVIPLNMRDGVLVCRGKGNKDWNYSAPHGAGRILSRTKAKSQLSMDDFNEEMKDVWSSSIGVNTLDESPMAYKNAVTIMEAIKDTVDIEFLMKPKYVFKASEAYKYGK